MKLSNIYTLGLGILLLGLIPSPAMAAGLDLFSDVDAVDRFQTVIDGDLEAPAVSVIDTDGVSQALDGVLGGRRTIEVSKLSGSSSKRTLLEVDANDGANTINLSSDSGVQPFFSITWDGITDVDANSDGTPDEDLTFGDTQNSLAIEITGYDVAQAVTLNFEIRDEFGNSGTISESVNSVGNTKFLYSNLVQNVSNTADVSFTDVRFVQLYSTNAPSSLDFEFDFIETAEIPVPFEFSPSLGIIICISFFGINKIRKINRIRKKLQSN